MKLEILDCVALSEQLADPEVFWIAARYLQVSPEIYPRPSDAGSEYDRITAKWLTAEAHPLRFADFHRDQARRAPSAGSRAARYPTLAHAAPAYEERCEGDADRHQVQYELLALTMRERRWLRGDEARVTEASSSDPEYLALPDTATQMETIHCYAATAQLLGEVDLSSEELEEWKACNPPCR